MKRYFRRTLKDMFLTWIALVAGTLVTAVLYATLIIAKVTENTSFLIAFATLIGFILLSLSANVRSFLKPAIKIVSTVAVILLTIAAILLILYLLWLLLRFLFTLIGPFLFARPPLFNWLTVMIVLVMVFTIGLVFGRVSKRSRYNIPTYSDRYRLRTSRASPFTDSNYEILRNLLAELTQYEMKLPYSPEGLKARDRGWSEYEREVDYISEGMIRLDAGEFERAYKAFRNVIIINPYNASAYIGTGLVLWQIDRRIESSDAFIKAIDLINKHDRYKIFRVKVSYENMRALSLLRFFSRFDTPGMDAKSNLV